MDSMKRMETYTKMSIINKYIRFLPLILICSCTTNYSGETKNIVRELDLISTNCDKGSLYIIKSDSIEILNGGLPPKTYTEYSEETIYSQAEEDIVFIEFVKSEALLQQVFFSSLKADYVHVLTYKYFKGDTISIDCTRDDLYKRVTIDKFR